MNASGSQKSGQVITREGIDRMPAEVYLDIERAGAQSHCFYKIIDAVSGCLYSQPRYILSFPQRRSLQSTKFANQSKSLLRKV